MTDHPPAPPLCGRGRAPSGRVVLWAAGIPVLIALAAGGWAMTRGGPGATEADPDLRPVARTSFKVTTTATGELEARRQTEIRGTLENESTIVEVVDEGAVVNEGDVVVRLNADELEAQVAEEQLNIETLKAELVAAENGYEIQKSENESKLSKARVAVEVAQLAVDEWRHGTDVQKRKDLDVAMEKATRDRKRLLERFERSEKLKADGFLSEDQYQQDHIALLEADAMLAKADLDKATYLKYQAPKEEKGKASDLAEAIKELERVIRQAEIELASKEADRVNKRRQMELRQDRLAKLTKQVESATIKATCAGLVVYASTAGLGWWGDQPLQIGRKVYPNEPLLLIPDTSEMLATVRVHETLAGRLRPDMPATITIDALPGKVFRGVVEKVGVMAESSRRNPDPTRREYSVKIAIKDVPAGVTLKPAMRCEAEILLEEVEPVLTVPLQAVFADGDVRYVCTPDSGGLRRVPVRVGRRSELLAEIVAGLDEGARVLVRDPHPGELATHPWDPAQLAAVADPAGEAAETAATQPETPAAAEAPAAVAPEELADGAG